MGHGTETQLCDSNVDLAIFKLTPTKFWDRDFDGKNFPFRPRKNFELRFLRNAWADINFDYVIKLNI